MPNCKECKTERRHQAQSVPFIVHEADMARMERSNKRLWIAILVLVVALLGTNLAWSIYEAQFIEEEWTLEAQSDEGDAIANGSGEVNYYGVEGKGNS